jgi:5-methylcytosine-specific restriction enzyme B
LADRGKGLEYPSDKILTESPIRELNVDELQLADNDTERAEVSLLPAGRLRAIAPDDAILGKVKSLLDDGFAGVIFVGPPGTSKTWYAEQVALSLADGDWRRVRFIQFHPSYQYEDFVEGYVPDASGGFHLEDRHLLEMCRVASEAEGETCVLVIDELSRCDPGRVFGEALTYVEMTKREQQFRVSSGRPVSVPRNLVFLSTMNPLDRGVDEVDVAFERRFAKIAMDPDPVLLQTFLDANGVDSALAGRVRQFFEILRSHENPYCKVGHAYFNKVTDEQSLRRLWEYQLQFHLQKATRLDQGEFKRLERLWKETVLLEGDANKAGSTS